MYICMCYIKQLAIKTKHFIGVDILVRISEFVVVAILSDWWLFYLEWWSVPTTVGTSPHLGRDENLSFLISV